MTIMSLADVFEQIKKFYANKKKLANPSYEVKKLKEHLYQGIAYELQRIQYAITQNRGQYVPPPAAVMNAINELIAQLETLEALTDEFAKVRPHVELLLERLEMFKNQLVTGVMPSNIEALTGFKVTVVDSLREAVKKDVKDEKVHHLLDSVAAYVA